MAEIEPPRYAEGAAWEDPSGISWVQDKLFWTLSALTFLPLFFDRSGIFNSLSFDAWGFPISLLLATLFPVGFFLVRSASVVLFMAGVIACVVLPFALFGIFNSEYITFSLVLSYLSSLFVGFCVYSLLKWIDPDATVERFLLCGVHVVAAVALLWVPFQADNVLRVGRANGNVMDLFVIYQVWVYWPTALAIALCASFLSSGPWLWVARGVLFLGIFFTGAREPFLFLFVFGLIFTLTTNNVKYFSLLLLSGGLLVAAMAVYIDLYPTSLISLKFSAMMSGEAGLDGARLGVIRQFELSEVNAFWGTGFSNAGIFGTPHNQYLELYYRGGIFGLVISAILFIGWFRGYGTSSKLAWSIFGAILLATNIVNTPIRVPYTGAIIWTFFFFLVESRPKHLTGREQFS